MPDESVFEPGMPFVLVKSHGGPYDDSAYVAGARLADLDNRLRAAAAFGLAVPPQTLYPSDAPQADLLAMKHGFTMRVVPHDQDWAFFYFTRAGMTDPYAAAERAMTAIQAALEAGQTSDDDNAEVTVHIMATHLRTALAGEQGPEGTT